MGQGKRKRAAEHLDVGCKKPCEDVVPHARGAVSVHAHIGDTECELEVNGTERGKGAPHGVARHIQRFVRVSLHQIAYRLGDVWRQVASVVGEEESCMTHVNGESSIGS